MLLTRWPASLCHFNKGARNLSTNSFKKIMEKKTLKTHRTQRMPPLSLHMQRSHQSKSESCGINQLLRCCGIRILTVRLAKQFFSPPVGFYSAAQCGAERSGGERSGGGYCRSQLLPYKASTCAVKTFLKGTAPRLRNCDHVTTGLILATKRRKVCKRWKPRNNRRGDQWRGCFNGGDTIAAVRTRRLISDQWWCKH